MSGARFTCWLVGPDGISLRVDAGGLLLGRTATCDIVLADTRASNRHGFVRVGPGGVEFVQLGRNPSYVNKEPIESVVPLRHGDRIDVPGLRLSVETSGELPLPVAWVLERTGSGSYGVHRSPFFVGGGEADHVRIRGWPPAAVAFHVVQGALLARFAVRADVDGSAVAIGDMVRLSSGATLRVAAESLRVFADGAGRDATTVVAEQDPFPDALLLETLDGAADLAILAGTSQRSARLDLEEALLMARLVDRRPGHEPGDFVLDDDLVESVWPGQVHRGSGDVQGLVARLRGRLVDAGLDPFRVLERSPRGDALRVRIGPLTRIGRT